MLTQGAELPCIQEKGSFKVCRYSSNRYEKTDITVQVPIKKIKTTTTTTKKLNKLCTQYLGVHTLRFTSSCQHMKYLGSYEL